jgi:hypothetical protein
MNWLRNLLAGIRGKPSAAPEEEPKIGDPEVGLQHKHQEWLREHEEKRESGDKPNLDQL